MEYLVDGLQYSFSYRELKNKYNEIVSMSDSDFIGNLPEVLHFACFVSYFKELPNIQTISDVGIIHELIHLLHIPEETDVKKVRELFERLLIIN